MRIEKILKPAVAVIGKMGSTDQGEGFIQALWAEASAHFAEVAPLAKRDERGNPVGVWGAMSDFSLSFRPWENGFPRGLYLAGVAQDFTDPATGKGDVLFPL